MEFKSSILYVDRLQHKIEFVEKAWRILFKIAPFYDLLFYNNLKVYDPIFLYFYGN